MWITNSSPTAPAGSPVAAWSIPEESMATWPCGSDSTAKIAEASAGIRRCTSKRSTALVGSAVSEVVSSLMPAPCHTAPVRGQADGGQVSAAVTAVRMAASTAASLAARSGRSSSVRAAMMPITAAAANP